MSDKLRNLLVRTASGVVLLGVVLGASFVGYWGFVALMMLITVVGVWEFYGLARAKGSEPQRCMGVLMSIVLFFAGFVPSLYIYNVIDKSELLVDGLLLLMLCAILLTFVKNNAGKRIAWTWYIGVSILSLLLAPDKEAALIFVMLGYYPLIKQDIDKMPLKWLIKLVFFNVTSVVVYMLLLWLFGLDHLMDEFRELGLIGLMITILLGNICFALLDVVLLRFDKIWKKEAYSPCKSLIKCSMPLGSDSRDCR